MASLGGRKPAGVTPEINVTPLVDVVLVLLIIFMVIAPQLENGVRVELPGILNPDPKLKGGLEPLTVTITDTGDTYLDKQPISAEDLDRLLREKHAADPRQRILLRGDQKVRYATMRTLFARCQTIGFPGVSLVVGERAGARKEADDGL